MNILITGSTGLIGSRLRSFLINERHRVIRLVRGAPAHADEIRWDPSSGMLDMSGLEGLDAVIHLAGESIASGRWTAGRRRRIRDSRLKGTFLLAQSLSRLFDPPKALVSISAVGYYGDRGEELLDEGSSSGTGFLPGLCREWEAAVAPAVTRGIRTVIPRVGMVLSAEGGVLALMLPIFRLGMGGRIGSGRQYVSWIDIDDLVRAINHLIHNESIHGPINAVSPNPVTNSVFSRELGRILSRPAAFVLPAFVARLVLGQMADEVLLGSTRASAARLIKSGYHFAFPELEGALRHILQKNQT